MDINSAMPSYPNGISSPAPAARAQPAPGAAARADDFDDLFNYDAGLDEVFGDLTPPKPASPKNTSRKARADIGLGIDKEVKIDKKERVPRVKLDENRLLSQAGIPRLRKRAKDLKFKGKGHEYSDAARLLSFYQLWLDDLFPKAKFLDALAMVEKLGHKKRVHAMRMNWINEGKPKDSLPDDSIFDEPVLPPRDAPSRAETVKRIAPIFEKNQTERPSTPDINEGHDEDIYDATPRISRTRADESSVSAAESNSIFGPKRVAVPEEPEDDLDALLAEQEIGEMNVEKRLNVTSQDQIMTAQEPNFDDEMEAMAEMGDMYGY